MLKKITLFLIASLSLCLPLKGEENGAASRFYIKRNDYTFSTVFEMISKDGLLGTAAKSVFRITTHYDLYDVGGNYEGQGACRFFCLGLFYTWGTEIDIYDAEGFTIGVIDGQAATSESGKFSIYDAEGNRLGIAYLDQNCSSFSIVHPDNSSRHLARLSRNFLENNVDCWDVIIYEPNAIPLKVIKVFAAFACDTQGKFKKDK